MTVEKGVVCRCDIAGIEFFSILCDASHDAATRRDSITLNIHNLNAGRAMSHRGALRQFVN